MKKIVMVGLVVASAFVFAGCDAMSVGTNEKIEQKDNSKNVVIQWTLKNGTGSVIYEGEIVDGKQEGNGTSYTDQGKKKYEGQWDNGEAQGNGKLYYESNGQVQYEWAFNNGKPEWRGKWFYQNGTLAYDWLFEDGKPEGTGKLFNLSGGVIFEGQFTGEEIQFEDIK